MDRVKNDADQSRTGVLSDESQQTAHSEDIQDMDLEVPESLVSLSETLSRNAADSLSTHLQMHASIFGNINQTASPSFHDLSVLSERRIISPLRDPHKAASFENSASEKYYWRLTTRDKTESESNEDSGDDLEELVEPTINSTLEAQSTDQNENGDSSSSSDSEPVIDWDTEVRLVFCDIISSITDQLKEFPDTSKYFRFDKERFYPIPTSNPFPTVVVNPALNGHFWEKLALDVSLITSQDDGQDFESHEATERQKLEKGRNNLLRNLLMDLWMLMEFSLFTDAEYEKVNINFEKIHDYITCIEIMKEDRGYRQRCFKILMAYQVSKEHESLKGIEVIQSLLNYIDVAVAKVRYVIFLIKMHEKQDNELIPTMFEIMDLERVSKDYKDWHLPR